MVIIMKVIKVMWVMIAFLCLVLVCRHLSLSNTFSVFPTFTEFMMNEWRWICAYGIWDLLSVQYYRRFFQFSEILCLCFGSPCRPIQDIVGDIREGNMRFSAGGLRELSKLLPDDVEVQLVAWNEHYSCDMSSERHSPDWDITPFYPSLFGV